MSDLVSTFTAVKLNTLQEYIEILEKNGKVKVSSRVVITSLELNPQSPSLIKSFSP